MLPSPAPPKADSTTSRLQLRLASPNDADLLLGWRNAPSTREASHTSAPIANDEHMRWLEQSLANPDRKLYIVEIDGIPAGTMRTDFEGSVYLLSWTVAPSMRGKGIGTAMVRMLVARIPESVRAEIKTDNRASVRIAEAAGLRYIREADGILHYCRNAIDQPPSPQQAAGSEQ